MTISSTLRPRRALPGIYFLPPPESPAPDLPPLDVAAFVGYAARGPVDLPVAVDDAATYAAIFGGDLALARADGEAIAWANLPAAVNLFFANGGRRCLVVRVTGKEARPSRFHLPGMVALPPAGAPHLVPVHAAWPGRWSETMRLATRLQWSPLDAAAFDQPAPGRVIWRPGGVTDGIQSGDVLQLTAGGATWLAPVTAMTPLAGTNGSGSPAFALTVAQAWRLVTEPLASPPPSFDSIYRLGHEEPELLDIFVEDMAGTTDQITLTLSGHDTIALAPGDVLWLRAGDQGYLCALHDLGPVQEPATSPPTGRVEAQIPHLLALPAEMLPAAPLEQVVRLRFDLLARVEALNPALNGLGFNLSHPRFWGEQAYLASSALYRPDTTPDQGKRARAAARFYHALQAGEHLPDEEKSPPDPAAFAALLAPLSQTAAKPTFLPLGMLSIVSEANYRGPDPAGTGDDKLDHFDVNRFFDEALLDAGPAVLESAAFDRRYVQKRRLRGLHSLYFTGEAALVSLPDAVHRAWNPAGPPEAAIVQPWQPQPPDEKAFLVCQSPPVVTHVQPAQGSTLGGSLVTITGRRFTASEQTAVLFDGVPAGNVAVADETTLTCIAPPHAAAGPVAVTVSNWFGAGSKADAYTYLAPPLIRLPQLQAVAAYNEEPLRRAQRLLLIFCQARHDVVAILSLPAHYLPQDCLAWQAQLRQDFHLPSWGYVRSDAHDVADLSYGAVYHPWLLVADQAAPGGLRAIPPEGVACGQIAWRERLRQVWIAPANQPLQGVLGLGQIFPAGDQVTLFERGFNLPGREVGLFRFISAHTLSDRTAWQQLSVRRLLILLRKIVQERGMDYVFESNDERFRAGVQFALEELLQGIYERGAFAGASPAQAYRVATSPDLNPRQSVEQGRFIAQIQVAPAQPLEFITVQLLRAGDGNLQVIEG